MRRGGLEGLQKKRVEIKRHTTIREWEREKWAVTCGGLAVKRNTVTSPCSSTSKCTFSACVSCEKLKGHSLEYYCLFTMKHRYIPSQMAHHQNRPWASLTKRQASKLSMMLDDPWSLFPQYMFVSSHQDRGGPPQHSRSVHCVCGRQSSAMTSLRLLSQCYRISKSKQNYGRQREVWKVCSRKKCLVIRIDIRRQHVVPSRSFSTATVSFR